MDKVLGFDQPSVSRRKKPDNASETYSLIKEDHQERILMLKKRRSQSVKLSLDPLLRNPLRKRQYNSHLGNLPNKSSPVPSPRRNQDQQESEPKAKKKYHHRL